MSRTEQIEGLLNDVESRLEALSEDAMTEIGQAKQEASANVARHDQARRELADVGAEIATLTAEREELPGRAYRAGLDGDGELEATLSERYRNLRPAIESLEDRRAGLKDEIRSLNPHGRGHPKEVQSAAYASAAGVAHERRLEMEDLSVRLTKAISDATDPVVGEHTNLKATVEALSRDVAWETSPAARGMRV
jgi:predicted  nucleic acid-binding Zn-ribbon protein